MTVEAICLALGGRAMCTIDESELASAVARLLTEAGIPFEQEYRLSSRDRIDFMVGSVGVELKVEGSPADIIRQLHRYAEHDAIEELVLVTTRRKHAFLIPRELRGKKIAVVCVGYL